MKKTIIACTTAIFMGLSTTALATGDITKMIGKWSWEGFVIEVNKCEKTEVCAKVVSGPKNVGMQMIQSKLQAKEGAFFGKIAHPQTGDTYNSRISMTNDSTWHIDGCTDKNVCASGDFSRVN